MKKKLEDEGLCGGRWKYMRGERIDELIFFSCIAVLVRDIVGQQLE